MSRVSIITTAVGPSSSANSFNVAERSFAVVLMRLLYCFDIKPKAGVTVPLGDDVWDGPMPATRGESMPVNLTVRNEARRKLIESEHESECAEFADILALGTL